MPEQFELNFSGPSDKEAREAQEKEAWKESMINQVLERPEEWRIEQYTKLIKQKPASSMSERQIAEGIIDPEKERLRILSENRDEDNKETTRTYRQ